MSANIPIEIQEEIIKRVVPVKSLIRFRSVSKQWKSLIDSSEFITRHSLHPAKPHHLLLRYTVASEPKYVSIVDDDTFPHHKFSPIVSPAVKPVGILDCSHGLVCLIGFDTANGKKLIVVWNPSIRKSLSIVLPSGLHVVGFGVCPKTSDPKIFKIKYINRASAIDSKAEVFTLSSRAWRGVPMNLSQYSSNCFYKQVVIDGVIHWVATNLITNNNMIISFDLTSEEFEEVDLPDSLAGSRSLDISKLNESLLVLDYRGGAVCDVWMMSKSDIPKSSFTKLFTVMAPNSFSIIGFRKNGQLIMDRMRFHRHDRELEVYEHELKHKNGLGIYGSGFSMASYTESLLLLNHYDSIIQ
ncbi:putative F-box domain-containing protein [Helianthus annuus]|nr:putative F-box domain-containing protein [Helianthus annuus]